MITYFTVLSLGELRIPHEIPIIRAVSPLSPVSIQVLMPAYLNCVKHGTTSI